MLARTHRRSFPPSSSLPPSLSQQQTALHHTHSHTRLCFLLLFLSLRHLLVTCSQKKGALATPLPLMRVCVCVCFCVHVIHPYLYTHTHKQTYMCDALLDHNITTSTPPPPILDNRPFPSATTATLFVFIPTLAHMERGTFFFFFSTIIEPLLFAIPVLRAARADTEWRCGRPIFASLFSWCYKF